MLVAEAGPSSGWTEFGALGLFVLLLAGWITFGGRWIANKFLKKMEVSDGVIKENSKVIAGAAEVIRNHNDTQERRDDSWKRTSDKLVKALEESANSHKTCQVGVEGAVSELKEKTETCVEVIAARKARTGQ